MPDEEIKEKEIKKLTRKCCFHRLAGTNLIIKVPSMISFKFIPTKKNVSNKSKTVLFINRFAT